MSKSQNTKKGLCITSEQLTEQYNHGNLPDDRLYYYRFKGELKVQITTQYGLYCEEADNKKEIEVIDFVPSYEEYNKLWQANKEVANRNIDLIIKLNTLKERNDSLNNRDINLCRIANGIRDENFALKELLKECKEEISNYMNISEYYEVGNTELLMKIDEALR